MSFDDEEFILLRPTWNNLQQFVGREQLVTCSEGGALGVPEQLSVCPRDMELPGEVFGVLQRRSGVNRSGHPSCRANSALSVKEAHAPLFDDETWLSEAQTSKLEDCSDDDDLSWAPLEHVRRRQGSKARGLDSELEGWSFLWESTFEMSTKTLRATKRLITPNGPADRNLAGRGLRQGGGVQAVLPTVEE
eukprot:3273097-Amphidinium_carterae.1